MIFRLNNRGKILAILNSSTEQDLSLLRGFDFVSLVEDDDRPLALALISGDQPSTESGPVDLRLKLSTAGSSSFRITASKDTDVFLLAIPLDADHDEKTVDNSSLDYSKQRARRLFDRLPLALLVVSDSGSIQAGNEVACQMFEFNANQLGALSIDRLVNPETSEIQLIDFLKRMIGRTFRARGLKQSGESFTVEVHAQFLDDSSEILLLSVFDISKQEELEGFKREILRVLRHGVRGPLTNLRLFLGTVIKGLYRTRTIEALEERATMMFDETSKLIELTSKLLAFENLDTEVVNIDWTIISVPELILDCMTEVSAHANIDFRYEELPNRSIMSTEAPLKKAICDLLSTMASTTQQRVTVEFELHPNRLAIVVSSKLASDQTSPVEKDEALLSLTLYRAILEACGAEVEIGKNDDSTAKVHINFITDSI